MLAKYLYNRTYHSGVGAVPYELLYEKSVDYSLLHTFGSVMYAHKSKEVRKKWTKHSSKGIFLGIDDVSGFHLFHQGMRTA